jgi:dipeptidase E
VRSRHATSIRNMQEVADRSSDMFLGSQGLGAFRGWLDELILRPRHAALVPTAANPMPQAPWARHVEDRLAACGVSVEQLDLEGVTPYSVASVLARVDLVFVTGGYPTFLLAQAQRTGFLEVVREKVRAGRLAYAGMSSGAALAGPDLALYEASDDRGIVSDTKGLALVPFLPLTHANRGRLEGYANVVAAHPEQQFVILTDKQAVVVAGDTWEVRESPIVDEEIR